MAENMLGPYGAWATGLAGDEPGRLSFRRDEFGRAPIIGPFRV